MTGSNDETAHLETAHLIVANWNMEWALPSTSRAKAMRSMIDAAAPDVICLTESFVGNLPQDGELIEAQADYGYPIREGRRKVLLWTRHRWKDIDNEGHPDMPPGRFISATLCTPGADIRIVGVCVPWAAAHVTTGRRDRVRWEDHTRYLAALGAYLRENADQPTIIVGDFNQTIPRSRQPIDVFRTLDEQVMGAGFEPASAGAQAETAELLIDHLFCSHGPRARLEALLPKISAGGRLSDHTGFVAEVSAHRSVSR